MKTRMVARIGTGQLRSSVLALAVALLAEPAAAQNRDFLFSPPRVTLAVRAGLTAPTAHGELFDYVTDSLTLSRGDFSAPDFQAELAVRVHDRVDLALNVGHSESSSRSEFVNWVEETDVGDLPIEQTTTFARTPVTVGLKGYLKDRGRSVSRFAWVPYGWAPYLTAGGGVVAYDFTQTGDFVDFQTREIFSTTFTSEGTALAAHLGAGIELSLGKHFLATGEARYLWANDEMDGDFRVYDVIDLSGAQLALGLALRF